jgi:hypothetical protein
LPLDESPALTTPTLLERSAALQAQLADVVERSRDLVWHARLLGGSPRHRSPQPVAGGSDENGRGDRRRSARSDIILRFLEEHRGEAFCADCLSTTLFDGKSVDTAVRQIEGLGARRRYDGCSRCGKERLVSRLAR